MLNETFSKKIRTFEMAFKRTVKHLLGLVKHQKEGWSFSFTNDQSSQLLEFETTSTRHLLVDNV